MPNDEKPVESRIVSAVGAVSITTSGGSKELSDRILAAMNAAVLQANEEGISTEEKNSEEIRKRMLDARQKVVTEYRAEQAERAEAAKKESEQSPPQIPETR